MREPKLIDSPGLPFPRLNGIFVKYEEPTGYDPIPNTVQGELGWLVKVHIDNERERSAGPVSPPRA